MREKTQEHCGMSLGVCRMSFARILVILAVLMATAFCWAGENPLETVEDTEFTQLLSEGISLTKAGKPGEAISYFDKVIVGYEEAYKGEDAKLYSGRWHVESLKYIFEAANAKTSAKVVSANWAYAYYLKAYSLLDLQRIGEAKELLERAITLSPHNSQFLSEMGNIYQREKNWPKALETFQAAEAAAREFSPPDLKTVELSRAMRGIGYVYVEQNRLDDAEMMYRQCLELDKSDARASTELQYVLGLRAKQANGDKVSPSTALASVKRMDPVYMSDAAVAAFVAVLECRKPSDAQLDLANLIRFRIAAARELERRTPGIKPPEVLKMLDARADKVKATIKAEIERDGCDASEIRKLVDSYKAFSALGRNEHRP